VYELTWQFHRPNTAAGITRAVIDRLPGGAWQGIVAGGGGLLQG
jgi:hypothetical protein